MRGIQARPRWMEQFGNSTLEFVRLRKRQKKSVQYIKARLAGGGTREQERRRRQIASGFIRTN